MVEQRSPLNAKEGSPTTGAHFRFPDMCLRLQKLLKQREQDFLASGRAKISSKFKADCQL